MIRVARLMFFLALTSVVMACGSAASSTPPGQEPALPITVPTLAAPTARAGRAGSEWPSELFLVRPEGANGSLVAYDMSNGAERFWLPAGMLSADGKNYYHANAGARTTTVTAFDPKTGSPRRSFGLGGQWELTGVAPTGRWLALSRIPAQRERQAWIDANTWQTQILIVDRNVGQAAHALTLDGNFEVETISASGQALYLIQHLPAVNPDRYLIRLYDLSAEALHADPLRSKGSDEVMAGLAWEGVASPDGRWLLTLYLSTRRDVAFIHALNMIDKYPLCIDLPSGSGNFSQLKDYTLALSPTGRTVYAANAALGVVAEVSLDQLQVVRQATFAAATFEAPAHDMHSPTAHGVISGDGQMLYFANGKEVWSYGTQTGKVSGPYLMDGHIRGLGLSGDGQRLYVAGLDRSLRVFATTTGAALSFQEVGRRGQ